MRRPRRPGLWLAIGAAAVSLLVIDVASQASLGGFTAGITNHADALGGGTLAVEHVYQSTSCALSGATSTTDQCSGSIAPTAATPATGSVSATDAITDNGTIPASNLNEQVSAPSCGVVELADQVTASNPMLPRYATTFSPASGPMSGSGSITLDGSTAYASDAVSQAQPNPIVSLGATYGLGIWFKTTSASGGPLFEIANSATATAGGDDRVLYMTSSGQLSFIQNTSGTKTTTTSTYNNGSWHFAYVTMSAVTVVGLGVESTTTIYVDGAKAATGGGLLAGYTADTGYWHLGWAPNSVTGVPAYFAGSLSDFVVFNTSPAPAAPTSSQLASQSAWVTWAAAATGLWPLDDSGTTTFAGPYPVLGSTSPCTMVDLTWGFTSPTSCAVAPESTTAGCSSSATLAAFADGAWQTVAAPGPEQTQTSTITTSRATTYNSYVSGLHLYAPLSFRVRSPSGAWSLTFTWPSALAAFIA